MTALAVISGVLLLRDIVIFNTYEHAFCHGVAVQPPDQCSGYNYRCITVPYNCDDTWQGWIAANRYHFSAIIPPNFGKASVLGYLWFIIQILWACVANLFFYTVNLLREPLPENPALYIAVLVGMAKLWLKKRGDGLSYGTGLQPFDPLNRAGRESPLGEAGFARIADAHAGLRGGRPDYVRAPPVFED